MLQFIFIIKIDIPFPVQSSFGGRLPENNFPKCKTVMEPIGDTNLKVKLICKLLNISNSK